MSKNWIISLIAVAIFIFSVISFYHFLKSHNNKKKDEYIKECIEYLNTFDYSKEEKRDVCTCRYKYLFSKYGNKIYHKNFVIPTKEDSLKVIECLLKLHKQNIDSHEILNRMRNKKQ